KKVSLVLEFGSGYPGNGGQLKAEGVIHITNQRVIFLSKPTVEHLKSLSIPLKNLRDGKLVQPWLGANYYTATVIPVPNGGMSAPGTIKITFKEGGGFEFSSIYSQIIQRMAEHESNIAPETYEQLPVYTPRETSENATTTTSIPSNAILLVPSPNPFITPIPTATIPEPTPETSSKSRKPFDREAFLAKHKVRKIQPHEKEASTSNLSVSSTKARKDISSTSAGDDQKNTESRYNRRSATITKPTNLGFNVAKKPITGIASSSSTINNRIKSINLKPGISSSAPSILSKSEFSTSQKILQKSDILQSPKPVISGKNSIRPSIEPIKNSILTSPLQNTDVSGFKNPRKVDAAKVAKLLNFAGRKSTKQKIKPLADTTATDDQNRIKSLVDICISTIIRNIEMLNDIGNVPIDLLRPVLKSVSAEQLKRLQDNSEELAEVSNDLCLREFRSDYLADKRIREELYNHEKLYWELDKERKTKEEEDERRIQILVENTRKRYAKEEAKKEKKKIKVLPVMPLPRNRSSRQQKSIIRKLFDSTPRIDRPFRTSAVATTSRSGSTTITHSSTFARGAGSNGSTVHSTVVRNSVTSVSSVRLAGVERRQNSNERFLPYRRLESRIEANSSRLSSQGAIYSRERLQREEKRR
ncbi:2188_t:CDS:10, partial [Ambispora leptoticha]